MAIDDVKIESVIKVVCLVVLSTYLSLNLFIALSPSLDVGNPDAIAKAGIIRPSCLLLLGGSNARDDFSAARLSSPGCPALNLAVSNELGSFDRYMTWLSGRAQAGTVVYSTMLVVSPSVPSDDRALGAIDHVVPLAGRLRVMFFGSAESSSGAFTSSGDQLEYVCEQGFLGRSLDASHLERGTPEVVAEIVRRVAAIKRATGAPRVVLHPPRVYIDARMLEDANPRLLEALGRRMTAIRRAGITVLDTPVVHTDKAIFCDDRHANREGRDLISAALEEALLAL
jgi:hypothetical protein